MEDPRRAPEKITDDLIQFLEERGAGDYIGEDISQLEHCLQCAHFGRQAGQSTLNTPSQITRKI